LTSPFEEVMEGNGRVILEEGGVAGGVGAREMFVFRDGNVRPSQHGSGSRASLPRDGDEEMVVESRESWT